MIVASVSEIAKVIANDTPLLAEIRDFLDAVDADADLGLLLRELPEAIASFSPFEDETAMIEVVRRETLRTLRALTLLALPARGHA